MINTQFALTLMASAVLAYKTDLTIVENTGVTADNLIDGYSLDSQYWVESDADGDYALVLRFLTTIPVDKLKDGNIVQAYL